MAEILYTHSPGWVQALGDEEVKGLEAKPGAFGKLIGILIMVYYNAYMTGEKPFGRSDSPSCILGNLLASRALVLLVICATRGIWWILEQPMTSVMQYHPMFQRVVRMLGMQKLVILMANYGGQPRSQFLVCLSEDRMYGTKPPWVH